MVFGLILVQFCFQFVVHLSGPMNTRDTNRCSVDVCLAGIKEPCLRLMPVVVHVSGAYGSETGREQYVGYWRPSAQTKTHYRAPKKETSAPNCRARDSGVSPYLGVALPWKYKHVYAEHMAWMLVLDGGLGHKFMFKLWTHKLGLFV